MAVQERARGLGPRDGAVLASGTLLLKTDPVLKEMPLQ